MTLAGGAALGPYEILTPLGAGFHRSDCMPFTKIDPRLDPLRSDPRYTDLVKRLAFPL
jgi:hypothetical protein